MPVWISAPNNRQMWPVRSTFLKTAWRSWRYQRNIYWCWRSWWYQRSICWCLRGWWYQRSICQCWRSITGLLWAFKWSNTFFHDSESKPLKDSVRERPSHCRFLTTSKSTGQRDCRAWSSAGSSFTSVVFIFSNRSRISSDAGSTNQRQPLWGMNELTAKTIEQMNYQVVFEDNSIYLKEKAKKKVSKISW